LIGVVLSGLVLYSGCALGQTGSTWGVAGTRAAVFADYVSNTGGQVEYWVEYGTSTNYGSQTAHGTDTVQKNVPSADIVQITGLQRSTTYHYRVCAQDTQQSGGPGCGDDKQFTTVNVDCDDTITADLHLSGNLDCDHTGGRDGPAVGADGINIDLAGHKIGGINVALDNTGGFDDVTIHDGTLYAIGDALVLDGASRNLVRSVSAGLLQSPFAGPSTSVGVRIQGGEANEVRHSNLQGAGEALRASDSPGLVFADSTADSGSGSRGGGAAVYLEGNLARVVRNHFSAEVFVNGSSNRILDNDIHAIGFGIDLFAGHDNLLAGNLVHDVGTLPFMEDAGDGIIVRPEAIGSRLRDNVVTSNEDDGIDVRSPSTKLRNNRADDNGDFGIDAVSGVTDLGGNTATGNGNPLQCRNVFCG
jgi:parallel beta-helix repeat protein